MKIKSWHTNVKHFVRLGLIEEFPLGLQKQISKSNYYRWKNEPADKYIGCEVTKYVE